MFIEPRTKKGTAICIGMKAVLYEKFWKDKRQKQTLIVWSVCYLSYGLETQGSTQGRARDLSHSGSEIHPDVYSVHTYIIKTKCKMENKVS